MLKTKNIISNIVLSHTKPVLVSHRVALKIICCLLYSISFISFAQLPSEGDCVDAIRLCDQDAIYHYEGIGPGAIDDANGAITLSCQSWTNPPQFESYSSWFKFTVQHSGELGFVIQPDTVEDFEFILFGPNPDCSDLANMTYWAACNTLQTPPQFWDGRRAYWCRSPSCLWREWIYCWF